MINKDALLAGLIGRYRERHRRSAETFERANQYLIRGGSHNLRLFSPYPFYDVRCEGSKVTDIDGNTYIDFWQGHFANILGHNPKVVLDAMKDEFNRGQGLATGFPGLIQSRLAEMILDGISAEKIRFTTSGTLGTMYAIMMSKAFTKRDIVMKVGGGWHGAHPYSLKGISLYDRGLNRLESAGLPSGIDLCIVTTKFNDVEDLEKKFQGRGSQVACLIVEPFIGAGGFMFGRMEYLKKARELTQLHGALLIFDEVVSGYRFHPGPLHSLYGIDPDLTVFGKAIGGGMPVSAVAGRAAVMELLSPDAEPEKRVKFEGGTFSAHPASMLAGLTFLGYLQKNSEEIYPRIGRLGEMVRRGIEDVFSKYSIPAKCTGGGGPDGVQSSLIGVHFLCTDIDEVTSPEQVWNPEICDFDLREKIFKLAMLEEGFNVFHGYGAISWAHTDEEIQSSLDAVERIAKKWVS